MRILFNLVKAKPYLISNGIEREHYDTTNRLIKLKPLNGTICATAECNKVEEIHWNEDFYAYSTKELRVSELRKRACLSAEQLYDYLPKYSKSYAIYLESVKKIEPIEISDLRKDFGGGMGVMDKSGHYCRFPTLTKAPQNMCYAWWFNEDRKFWEPVIVISIHAEPLCNILNGIKDIETRREIVNGLKELIK